MFSSAFYPLVVGPPGTLKNAVVCFTRRGNQLSQWRAYSPLNRGISVGFKIDALRTSATRQRFSLRECIYDAKRQETIAEAVLENLVHHVPGATRDPALAGIDDLLGEFFRIAAFLKHPSFSEEEEWRLISDDHRGENRRGTFYREGKSMLIPYQLFDLPRAEDGRVEIEHVIVGPTPHVAQAVAAVVHFLSSQNVGSPQVEYCGIPLREA